MRWMKTWLVVGLILAFATAGPGLAQTKLKVGFIYVGPIGDYGWTHAHNQARLIAEKTLPIETLYVESVPEAQVEPFIDKLIQQGSKVVLTTSFGFMDGTLAMAKRYPNILFGHASGFKRNPNMFTYMADFYQIYYLNGLMAGALTKTGKVAYVGAFPIPEVKRHLGALALALGLADGRAGGRQERAAQLQPLLPDAEVRSTGSRLRAAGALGADLRRLPFQSPGR